MGRLQFGADLDLHFRTLIGTGTNPNVAAVVRHRHRAGLDRQIVEGIATSGKPVEGFAIEQNGDINTIANASAPPTDGQARLPPEADEAPLSELWVSTKCGESDTDLGLASCPPSAMPSTRLWELGQHAVFGETVGDHRRRAPGRGALQHAEIAEQFMAMFDRYQRMIEATRPTTSARASRPRATSRAG
jgi:(2R)-sulfolactate sulfo-lyase subunit beta